VGARQLIVVLGVVVRVTPTMTGGDLVTLLHRLSTT
jgi:hypothetical protein